ncbi:peptidase S41 [Deinococcus seoulensis]|uniref:Peptidase S41 n=1 Tax=Deinococcus seoulensis TaxID=1837379 RepID=A0ABQ2RPA2_9DEIO|nr:peptidase S41 [Deinococcus seoulensis]
MQVSFNPPPRRQVPLNPIRRRRTWSALTAALLCAALPLAAASPATDLYRDATTRVLRDYYGWSTADLKALTEQYGRTLEERCAPAGDACPFETAREVLTELFTQVGDAHTSVRDPESALRLREVQENLAVPRTGARVVSVPGGLLVASVMPGSPAEQAGLRPFDLLTRVNGAPAGKNPDPTPSADTGNGTGAGTQDDQAAPGTDLLGAREFTRLERAAQPIQVEVTAPGRAPRPLTLTTATLRARDEPTLNWVGPDRRTALISVASFLPSDTAAQFLARVREAEREGARALLIDLRFNGGGSLTQCVAAASIFAPTQYRSRFRTGGTMYAGIEGRPAGPQDRQRPPDTAVWRGPAAVLVGPNTASCSEVFTYYAQRAGALAVGEVTRGVGNSGVTLEPLPDGGVVSVTVLRAYWPDGTPLPAHVTPDVPAPTDLRALTTQGQDTCLNAALNALNARTGHLPAPATSSAAPQRP